MKTTESTETRANTLRAMMPTGGHVLALAVLLGTLVVVFVAWRYARDREMRAAEVEFIARTSEVVDLIRGRLVNYELIAGGGASLFASIARPTPRHWQAYVDGMNIRRRFTAMVGLGFAGYVPGGRLDDLQLEWRESGYGLLQVRPYGHREFYGPILYLEPKTPANLSAIGYDMYSEPVRHAAMQAARDTGDAHLSGIVQLVQDGAEKITGLLLYIPVFRSGDHPQTVAARRQSLQGWVYVPFRVKVFVPNALGNAHRDARFRIFDITDGAEELLFTTVIAQGEQAPAFRHSQLVEQYGRRWRMEFDSLPLEAAVPGLGQHAGAGPVRGVADVRHRLGTGAHRGAGAADRRTDDRGFQPQRAAVPQRDAVLDDRQGAARQRRPDHADQPGAGGDRGSRRRVVAGGTLRFAVRGRAAGIDGWPPDRRDGQRRCLPVHPAPAP